MNSYILLFFFLVCRNFAVIYTIDTFTSNKIQPYRKSHQDISGCFEPYVIQAAGLETITLHFLPTMVDTNIVKTIVLFIPVSFAFEIMYDFFHYWIHRSMHIMHDPWHKTHHRHVHLKQIIAFYQNIFDLILSNSIPFLVTTQLIHTIYPLSHLEIALILNYKIFIEVAGHMACSSGRSCSFPQCIWLPRLLGIELYADDHALHHSSIGCNYAKRFSLWDKVFGTYKSDRIRIQSS